MGDGWPKEEENIRKVISGFPNNKIVIFPQTIYYSDTNRGKRELQNSIDIYNNHNNLTICAREKISYEKILNNYTCNTILVPDIVLYLKTRDFGFEREGILLCLRSDKEKSIKNDLIEKILKKLKNIDQNIEYTDTVIKKKINENQRNEYIHNKLEEFAKHKLAITDRLHGMIFAYITRTPCIVLGNYNHKVKGVYQWIKECKYIIFMEDENNIENVIETLYNYNEEKNYINFEKEFDKIKTLLKRK